MDQKVSKPYIIDIYPHKAQYGPGETVRITAEVHNPGGACEAAAVLKVMKLEEVVHTEVRRLRLLEGASEAAVFEFLPEPAEWQGFGVDLELTAEGAGPNSLSTAFDVASTWRKAPRYGFLCDFSKEGEEDCKSVEQMVKYHLNVVQFYDWMYRHDNLIPPGNYYIDPLNRELSLKAIENRIRLCRERGMTTMAYSAIYASSSEFFEEHRDWALYGNNGAVQSLGDWLFIMNISDKSPWTSHIIGQFAKVLRTLDFDGIHMDTYGFPKTAYSRLNGRKSLQRLREEIPGFIAAVRSELENYKEGVGLTFNAVNNWPIETAAAAATDAVYIEVWEPNERYRDLSQIVNRARELGKKPVILAAYLSSFKKGQNPEDPGAENCFRLASAVIFASGGYHLLLGEDNGLLREEYFVNYARIGGGFVRAVRNYYDFIVRYANLLYDLRLADISMTHANGRNGEFVFINGEFSSCGEPDKIWSIVKEMPGCYTISLINLTGISSDIWNESKPKMPSTIRNIQVQALIDEEIEGIYTASPDVENGVLREIPFRFVENGRGRCALFNIPLLEAWDLVYIKVKSE